jgi:hypothetical protein
MTRPGPLPDALHALTSASSAPLSFLFMGEHIRLDGAPLRAPFATYASLAPLGQDLDRLGLNTLRLHPSASRDDLAALASALSGAQAWGDAEARRFARFAELSSTTSLSLEPLDSGALSPVDRVARVTSAALVVMERFYDELRRAELTSASDIKRVSRSLVRVAAQNPALLLGFLSNSSARRDPPMLAVKGAVFAAVCGARVALPRRNLTDLTMTALLYDVGVLRASGLWSHAEAGKVEHHPMLTDDARDRLPEATAFLMSLFGHLNEASLARAVFGYESHYVRVRASRGFPYDGDLAPTLEALLLAAIRRVVDLVSLDDDRSMDRAFEQLVSESSSRLERHIARLLADSCGLYTRGTPVELTSGWRGVVVSNHPEPARFRRPVVRLVYDPRGNHGEHGDVDLSDPRDNIVALGSVRGVERAEDERLRAVSAQVWRAVLAERAARGAQAHAHPLSLDEPTDVFQPPPHMPLIGAVSDTSDDDDTSDDLDTGVSAGDLRLSVELPSQESLIQDMISVPSDRIDIVNIDDIAHMLPSASILGPRDAYGSPMPPDDDGDGHDETANLVTSTLVASPDTWDSQLDDSGPSSKFAILSGSFDVDEVLRSQESEATATSVLPHDTIATLMFADRVRRQADDTPSRQDEVDPDTSLHDDELFIDLGPEDL